MRSLLLSFLITLVLACGSPSSESLADVMILVPNAKGVFEPQKKRLTTISNISKLEGSVTNFIGGARLDENNPKIANASNWEEYKKAHFLNEGGSVRAQFIEKDGVLWPADFHSWAMTTAYWNMEQAFLYFQEIYDGRNPNELLGIPTYYWLDDIEKGQKQSSKDNALFHSLGLIAVLPFEELQTIPASINIGVMAHEYAHFVFDARVHHSEPSPPSYIDKSDPKFIMDSINEGLADFFAYGVTRRLDGQDNANFLSWTLDSNEAENRNFLSRAKCKSNLEKHSEYGYGTLFAASFYQAADPVGKFDLLAKYIINAYDSESPRGIRQHYIQNNATPQNISFESVADVFLAHITDADLRRRTCNEMLDRLELNRTLLTHCPSSSVRNTNCQKP